MNAFWIVTIIFALVMLVAGLYLSRKDETKDAPSDTYSFKKAA